MLLYLGYEFFTHTALFFSFPLKKRKWAPQTKIFGATQTMICAHQKRKFRSGQSPVFSRECPSSKEIFRAGSLNLKCTSSRRTIEFDRGRDQRETTCCTHPGLILILGLIPVPTRANEAGKANEANEAGKANEAE
jgi:hypothetical protein